MKGPIAEAVLTPEEQGFFRRHRRLLLGLAAAVAALLFVGRVITERRREVRSATTLGYGARGFRAVYDLFRLLGYPVLRWARHPRNLPNPDRHALFLLAPTELGGPEPLHREAPQSRDYVAWVRAGGLVILAPARPGAWPAGWLAPSGEMATRPWGGETPDPGPSVRRLLREDLVGGRLPVFANGRLWLERRLGAGRILFPATAYLFRNAALRYGRTGPVLVQALAPWLAGRRLLFDEWSHGLSVTPSTWALLFRPRVRPLTVTLLFVLAAGLWWGLTAFGPPERRAHPLRRRREEYVVAMGELYRRGGGRSLAVQLLVRGYAYRLRRCGAAEGAAAFEKKATRRWPRTDAALLREGRTLYRLYREALGSVKGRRP